MSSFPACPMSRKCARNLDIPTLVFLSGSTDLNHRAQTTEELARMLPNSRIADPPWGNDEWNERSQQRWRKGAPRGYSSGGRCSLPCSCGGPHEVLPTP